MVDFFKELEKAAKHLDKIAKEWEPKNKPPKEQKITQSIFLQDMRAHHTTT